MTTFATERAGRDAENLCLTILGAMEMRAAGFRFSVFGERGQYRLSLPFTIRWSIDRDIITFIQ